MWDLTVRDDHDFYVQAASTAILVHNCPGPGEPMSPAAKGAAGVDQTANDIEQAGGRIIGREIGMKRLAGASGWTCTRSCRMASERSSRSRLAKPRI
jgi:hypothetical protein